MLLANRGAFKSVEGNEQTKIKWHEQRAMKRAGMQIRIQISMTLH